MEECVRIGLFVVRPATKFQKNKLLLYPWTSVPGAVRGLLLFGDQLTVRYVDFISNVVNDTLI